MLFEIDEEVLQVRREGRPSDKYWIDLLYQFVRQGRKSVSTRRLFRTVVRDVRSSHGRTYTVLKFLVLETT